MQTVGAMVIVTLQSIVSENETSFVTLAVVCAVPEVPVGVFVPVLHVFVLLQIVAVVLYVLVLVLIFCKHHDFMGRESGFRMALYFYVQLPQSNE